MVDADDLTGCQRALLDVGTALAAGRPAASSIRAALAAGLDAREIAALAAVTPGLSEEARDDFASACRSAGAVPLQVRPEHFPDFSTSVLDTGGSGEPIVLIHGMGLDWRATQHVVPRLAPTRRVIAFDVRGHGLAARTTRLDSMAAAASDLRLLLDRLDVERAELAGLSMGGLVALQFADDYADRVSALSLVCMIAKGTPAMEARASDAERDGLPSIAAETLVRWLGARALAEDGWGVRYARERLRVMPVGHWAAAWRTLARTDLEAALGRIRVPTRAIAGGEDASSPPALMRAIAERIPGSRFLLIPDAPHFVGLTDPAGLARALLA